MKRFSLFSFAFLALAMYLSAAVPQGDPPGGPKEKPKRLPPLGKELPETIEDLRAMENHAQKVLELVMPSVVCIQMGGSSGSGVIVTATGLVLTAGHVSGQPGTNAFVILQNGKRLKAKSLGRNGGIDSGMMQILEGGPFPHVEMGASVDLKPGHWCICVGHPGGLKANRGLVVRVGRILFASNSFLRTDCYLVGGDSGGPLFNMRGEVIGIHSRIGSSQMTENMHVPIDTYHQTWDRLVKGESWGGMLGQPIIVQSAGGKIIMEKKGEFKDTDPFDAKMKTSHVKTYSLEMTPGFAYTIDMKSSVVDAFLRLEDSTGKQVAEDDDGGGDQKSPQDSRIVYRPARQGTYKIFATTFDGNQTGAYTLTVRRAEIIAKDLPSGTVDILSALKLKPAALRKAIGDFERSGMEAYANAHLLDEQGKPMAEKEATFLWKSGKFTATSDDQGQVRVKLAIPMVDGLMLEVPDGLRAMVKVTNSDGIPLPMGGGQQKGTF